MHVPAFLVNFPCKLITVGLQERYIEASYILVALPDFLTSVVKMQNNTSMREKEKRNSYS